MTCDVICAPLLTFSPRFLFHPLKTSPTTLLSQFPMFSLHFTPRQTNPGDGNPFEMADESRDHVEHKATAYQSSKTSDNNPIANPPVFLSCPNSTITRRTAIARG